MRKIILAAAILGLQLVPGIAPAMATDQSTAVELCGKNPNCGLIRGNGGVGLWVKTAGGGTNEVWCPDNGPCECIVCNPPAREAPRFGVLIRPQFNMPQSLSSTGDGPAAPFFPATMPNSEDGNPPIIY